jgi:hypothetical protein
LDTVGGKLEAELAPLGGPIGSFDGVEFGKSEASGFFAAENGLDDIRSQSGQLYDFAKIATPHAFLLRQGFLG